MIHGKFQFNALADLLILAMFVACPTLPLQANDIVVTTLADDTDPGNGQLSLREAIELANSETGANQILFAHDLVGEILLTEGEIEITDGVEVLGPGAHVLSVSGNETSRIFRVVEDTKVLISGLTISDGLADQNANDLLCAGGAILNRGDLTLWGVVLRNNRAQNFDPEADVEIDPFVLNFGGGAIGGAVFSNSKLTMFGCEVHGNQAIGADGAKRPFGNFGMGPAFVSDAFGGAIYCLGESSISHSEFTDNLAKAGSNGEGDFFGSCVGGAVYNGGDMHFSHCSFEQNLAQAGNEGLAAFHDGHALGGALGTGSVFPLVDPGAPEAALTIHHCNFDDNHAIGGDNNTTLFDPDAVPRADGPNNGYGGAILAFEGSIDISHVVVTNNSAVAGSGGPDGGATFNGGLGVGGGIFLFGFIRGVDAHVSHVYLAGNQAIGGEGTDGAPGGSGIGGGLTIGTLDSPFADPEGPGVAAELSHLFVRGNVAIGASGSQGADGGNGDGGGIAFVRVVDASCSTSKLGLNRAIGGRSDGKGGDGRGGGILNEEGASLTLIRNAIVFNRAAGGTTDGTGFGGGVFNAGDLEVDFLTYLLTRWNFADNGPNFFGL